MMRQKTMWHVHKHFITKLQKKTEVNQPVVNVYAPLTQENAIGCHAHKTSHNLNLIDGKINNL